MSRIPGTFIHVFSAQGVVQGAPLRSDTSASEVRQIVEAWDKMQPSGAPHVFRRCLVLAEDGFDAPTTSRHEKPALRPGWRRADLTERVTGASRGEILIERANGSRVHVGSWASDETVGAVHIRQEWKEDGRGE